MSTSRLIWQSLNSRPAIISAVALAGVGSYYGSRSFFTKVYAESIETPPVFGGFGPKTLRLRSTEQVNHNTKRLVFEFPNESSKSGSTLTSALLTFSWPQDRWLPVLRPYTPISNLEQKGSLELMVKQYPNGKASTHLHSLVPGDTLTFMAALKGYPWKSNKYSQIHLIAGGAGITPIYQLVQGILNNPDDKTKINLIFGVNTEQDLLLKDEFDEYRRNFPDRFRYTYTISHPKEDEHGFRKGYVTEELLKEVIEGSGKDTHVFVCGPPGMESSLVGSRGSPGILSRLGFEKDQIYKF